MGKRKRNNNPWGLYDPRAPGNLSPVERWDPDSKPIVIQGGSQWFTGPVELRHKSSRNGYSSSPVYTIPGTSSKGRKPTSYARLIFSQVTNTWADWHIRSIYGDVWSVKTPLQTDSLFAHTGSHKIHPFISPVGTPYSDVDFENARSRAVTECLVKLGGNKVDTGTALAELGKTTTHLAQTAKDLWGTVKALKGKRWGELTSILSKRSNFAPKINPGMTAARYWLEYNYAWKPLFKEAEGLMELIKLQLEPALLVHANRTVSWPHESNEILVKGTQWYHPTMALKAKVKTESCCRLTGRIDNTLLRGAAAGFTNPAAIAWELMPYSFVIDWSLPIGNYLQAASATQGLSFVWGSITQRFFTKGTVRISGEGTSNDFWKYKLVQEGNAEVYKFGMARTVLSDFPRPLLYAKSPLSSSHAISALALLRSLF